MKRNFNKYNLFFFLLFIFSFLFFFFVFFQSELIFRGTNRYYYILYYVISSFCLLISLFGLLTKNYILKVNLIIIICSTFVSFYLFEAGIRSISYFENKSLIKSKIEQYQNKNNGKKYDLRTKIEVFKDLSRDDKKITMNVPPAFYLLKKKNSIHPLTSKSNARMINCNENGFYQIIDTDRYGFNNKDRIWESDLLDFVFVGDSFTQGACVNKPDDIVSQFELLSNKKTLNLGYGSNGPLSEYATLREYLFDKEFKNIIWMFYEGNDISELFSELKNEILTSYIDDENFSQNLKKKQKEIDAMSEKIILELYREDEKKIINFAVIKDFMKLTHLRLKLNFFLPTKSQLNVHKPIPDSNFQNILILVKKFTESKNSKLYFVYLPEYERYSNSKYDNQAYTQVKKMVQSLDIPFIDLHEDLIKKSNDPINFFPFRTNGHYTSDGYKRSALYIYNFVKKEK